MKSKLRKIGNSRGVLIPASLLSACAIEDDIELSLDGNRIVIEAVNSVREGWFAPYQAAQDEDAWSGLIESEVENEDWQW